MCETVLSTKEIFPPQIELEVVRSFRRTTFDTFEYINVSEIDKTDECYANGTGNNRKIRPTTYKTFLKVKNSEKVAESILNIFRNFY